MKNFSKKPIFSIDQGKFSILKTWFGFLTSYENSEHIFIISMKKLNQNMLYDPNPLNFSMKKIFQNQFFPLINENFQFWGSGLGILTSYGKFWVHIHHQREKTGLEYALWAKSIEFFQWKKFLKNHFFSIDQWKFFIDRGRVRDP